MYVRLSGENSEPRAGGAVRVAVERAYVQAAVVAGSLGASAVVVAAIRALGVPLPPPKGTTPRQPYGPPEAYPAAGLGDPFAKPTPNGKER